jgi:hypothetical protein
MEEHADHREENVQHSVENTFHKSGLLYKVDEEGNGAPDKQVAQKWNFSTLCRKYAAISRHYDPGTTL